MGKSMALLGISMIKKVYKTLGLDFEDDEAKLLEGMGAMDFVAHASAAAAILTMEREREAIEEAREDRKRTRELQEMYFSQLLAKDQGKPSNPMQ